MKILKILLFYILAITPLWAQSNINSDDLNASLIRLNKELQFIKSRTQMVQDSIKIIETVLNQYKLSQINKNGFVCNTITNSEATVKDKPDINGNPILKIPKNNSLKVMEYKGGGYWMIEFNNTMGYVNDIFLIQTAEMKNIVLFKNELHNKQATEKNLKHLEESYGKEIADKIIAHNIWIGMTDAMARESIGYPKKVNRTSGSWGVKEQWVYEDKYLYFENKILTSYQDSY